MLTDTFHDRYQAVVLWKEFGEPQRRLLAQAYRILSDDFFPFYDHKGHKIDDHEQVWKKIERTLSRELGLESLSPQWLSTYRYNTEEICKNFVLAEAISDPDWHMKTRISLIELAFREREAEIGRDYSESARKYAELMNSIGTGIRLPGSFADGWAARKAKAIADFDEAAIELNERFRRAGVDLSFHRGHIQRSADPVTAQHVEEPFWREVLGESWDNVATDMKEALDRRDNGGRDPALYAAKALESAIKVITSNGGWNTGKEKGAHNYKDSLLSERSGRFLAVWEADSLKGYFSNVRNPLGHGPGNEVMPALTSSQTNWAIEFAMIWIKSLAERARMERPPITPC